MRPGSGSEGRSFATAATVDMNPRASLAAIPSGQGSWSAPSSLRSAWAAGRVPVQARVDPGRRPSGDPCGQRAIRVPGLPPSRRRHLRDGNRVERCRTHSRRQPGGAIRPDSAYHHLRRLMMRSPWHVPDGIRGDDPDLRRPGWANGGRDPTLGTDCGAGLVDFCGCRRLRRYLRCTLMIQRAGSAAELPPTRSPAPPGNTLHPPAGGRLRHRYAPDTRCRPRAWAMPAWRTSSSGEIRSPVVAGSATRRLSADQVHAAAEWPSAAARSVRPQSVRARKARPPRTALAERCGRLLGFADIGVRGRSFPWRLRRHIRLFLSRVDNPTDGPDSESNFHVTRAVQAL